jgi:hypothetical protein
MSGRGLLLVGYQARATDFHYKQYNKKGGCFDAPSKGFLLNPNSLVVITTAPGIYFQPNLNNEPSLSSASPVFSQGVTE